MVPPVDECIQTAIRDPALSGFARGYLRLLVRQAQAALRAKIARAVNRRQLSSGPLRRSAK